ncbi:MAG: Npun_F0494 family protein [Brasilonema sp.]
MPNVDSQNQKTFTYSGSTVERAERALVCSPFNPCLFETMRSRRVALNEMTANLGVKNGYTKHYISELAADNALAWLIQVGVLRRDVDGQGITDSFRLTPLGRQIVEQFQRKSWRTPTWSDNLYNAVIRWFRLPF